MTARYRGDFALTLLAKKSWTARFGLAGLAMGYTVVIPQSPVADHHVPLDFPHFIGDFGYSTQFWTDPNATVRKWGLPPNFTISMMKQSSVS
jgi:hypothetical protein